VIIASAPTATIGQSPVARGNYRSGSLELWTSRLGVELRCDKASRTRPVPISTIGRTSDTRSVSRCRVTGTTRSAAALACEGRIGLLEARTGRSTEMLGGHSLGPAKPMRKPAGTQRLCRSGYDLSTRAQARVGIEHHRETSSWHSPIGYDCRAPNLLITHQAIGVVHQSDRDQLGARAGQGGSPDPSNDGPDRTFTPPVLTCWRKKGQGFVFSWSGRQVAIQWRHTQRIPSRRAHDIGNHTFTIVNLGGLERAYEARVHATQA